MVAGMLGAYLPWLKPLGHHYDDFGKVIGNAFRSKGNKKILYRMLGMDPHKAHDLEHRTDLHIHSGRSFEEIGLVLTVALGAAFISDHLGKKDVSYPLRVALEAFGTWPLFNALIAGELTHLMGHIDDIKQGEHIDDLIKQVVVNSLLIIGIARKNGSHELIAGAVMAAILAGVGNIQTNAVEQGLHYWEHEALAELPETIALWYPGHPTIMTNITVLRCRTATQSMPARGAAITSFTITIPNMCVMMAAITIIRPKRRHCPAMTAPSGRAMSMSLWRWNCSNPAICCG